MVVKLASSVFWRLRNPLILLASLAGFEPTAQDQESYGHHLLIGIDADGASMG